jgi:hypothetical protein
MRGQCPSNPILFPIPYLLQRKYGDAVGGEQQGRRQAELEAYRAELQGLEDERLEVLVNQELAEEARQHHEEPTRFFHQPNAAADFQYWGWLPLWTLEEAIALTCGKDPAVVTWAEVEHYVGASPFATRFCNLRRFVLRAREAGQLTDPVPPEVYVVWAKAKGILLPTKLKTSIAAGQHEGDRKGRNKQITASGTNFEGREAADKALGTKERNTFLKLVIGMAIRGYGFDPHAAKSPKTKEIADDLEALNIPLDQDTIRAKLGEAVTEFKVRLESSKAETA